jgi:hypothetical protein
VNPCSPIKKKKKKERERKKRKKKEEKEEFDRNILNKIKASSSQKRHYESRQKRLVKSR